LIYGTYCLPSLPISLRPTIILASSVGFVYWAVASVTGRHLRRSGLFLKGKGEGSRCLGNLCRRCMAVGGGVGNVNSSRKGGKIKCNMM
jgi:hypothetical protein